MLHIHNIDTFLIHSCINARATLDTSYMNSICCFFLNLRIPRADVIVRGTRPRFDGLNPRSTNEREFTRRIFFAVHLRGISVASWPIKIILARATESYATRKGCASSNTSVQKFTWVSVFALSFSVTPYTQRDCVRSSRQGAISPGRAIIRTIRNWKAKTLHLENKSARKLLDCK